MTGSPHYSFEIGEQASKIYKGKDELLVVYLAAMTKFSLENPELKTDQKRIKTEAVKQILAYCQSQKIPLTKELKRLQKAYESGELEKNIE
jgi:hypothetical protein